jgi:seryl-tRNA synthetase
MDAPTFRQRLFEAGHLIPTGVDGLYGRSGAFEDIVTGLGDMVRRESTDQTYTRVRYPPIIPRKLLVDSDYLASFPDLAGSIHIFTGDDFQHAELLSLVAAGKDWSPILEPAEVVMSSAACHSLYPSLTGRLPEGGVRFDIMGFCFRHEPSVDPARMQSFRMHELVVVGSPEQTHAHREEWVPRALAIMERLQLPAKNVIANDPFFGRAGRILAAQQQSEALKIEIVTAASSDELTTAAISCNEHHDHFGVKFGISTADGNVATGACVAFGLERLTLALFRAHGMDIDAWPADVRDYLWPSAAA